MSQDTQFVAREIVGNWLSQQGWNQNQLANAAGINRSIVSRFLGKGSNIDADPAIKIFNVVQNTLTIYEKRQLLEGFGLLSLAEAINPSFTNPDGFDLKQPRTGHYAGLELLMHANPYVFHV